MINKSGRAIVVILGLSGFVWGQGSLIPPSAPAPSMRTLEKIEPRSPISSVPTNITQSGSYYLTSNLISVTGINGITVAADWEQQLPAGHGLIL